MDFDKTAILPAPQRMDGGEGEFLITESTRIVADPSFASGARILSSWIESFWELALPVDEIERPHHGVDRITIGEVSTASKDFGPEEYELRVSPDGIDLAASAPAGAFHGIQTLEQLLGIPEEREAVLAVSPRPRIPCVVIRDHPRFAWRGLLLDCCRHFMEPDYIRRMIDLLAYHRMNRLHLHLTEDQGWRVEILRYPRLTEVGAWRGAERYGGFYSREELRSFVEYGAQRGVTIVPEIEMPGHCTAALASYPELSCTGGPFEVADRWGIFEDVFCAGNDEVFEFLENVLEEVLDIFPSEYIHIGGDECPKTRWKDCPKCQDRIRREGLADESELQSWFVRRIGEYLAGKGRKMIGWDEIMQGGLAPGAVVQAWHGHEPARLAASAGHEAIVSPTAYCYLDYPAEKTDLRKVHSFDPIPPGLEEEHRGKILGAECNMWTERAPQETVDGKVFPRICALAEKTWSADSDWDDFVRRMKIHCRRLRGMGVELGEDPSFSCP